MGNETGQSTTERRSFDEKRAEQFAARMIGALNEGGLCLMTSLGHRTGLFDTVEKMGPATSAQIAGRADLDERYVREWLDALTVAGVVEHDPDERTYHLPAEHAAFLTRSAGADNIAAFSQWIPVLAEVEDEVAECFRAGGGVSYGAYGRFHEVMAEESALTLDSLLEDEILGLVPGIKERLKEGIRVLDLGCGRGQALLMMAESYPDSTFTGIDLSGEVVEHARAEADERGLSNVQFIQEDLADFEEKAEPNSFEFITTFDAVHDQPCPKALLRGIEMSLTENGYYLAQDVHASRNVHENLDHPIGTLLYATSVLHCMTVSLEQGGPGLGTMLGVETIREMLEGAGFRSIEVHTFEEDIQNCYFVCQP